MAMQTDNIIIQIGNEIKILEGEELIDFNNMRAQVEAEAVARQAEADTKALQRQALLNRLGLTEEEARILLGGN